ncbi:MAG: T9SS type A sorting domain-containing protein [Bacteroidetes bacterium]|nr:T9SS type A sorting domain-containing protein [Bacteroidota bacterium]
MNVVFCCALIMLLYTGSGIASSFYVAPGAAPMGTGSIDSPWTLQTALDQPDALLPGDTVWLRGGTYTNTVTWDPAYGNISFVCNTNGSVDAPIVFRNYRNERATLDGEMNQIVLYLGAANSFTSGCSNTWFWGIEVMSSAAVRASWRSYIQCLAPNIKFINMVLHDMADGIDLWNAAKGAELYGCLIYHNGWDDGTLAHGHGIYTQNDTTNTRIIHDNIFFSGYGFNVKLWSTNQGIDNYDIRNNIVFNGGACSRFDDSRMHNFYIVNNNPDRPTRNLVMKHNYTYAGITASVKGLCNNIGANYGSIHMTLDSNYFLGQLRLTAPFDDFSANGNRIYGGTALPYLTTFGDIDWSLWRNTEASQDVPTEGVEYFVLPNKYEQGTAHVAIYNWENADEVRIDISQLQYRPGDRYQLINVTDYYNDVITGVCPAGSEIIVPMTGHSTASPIGGEKTPVSQFPKFGAFVIRKFPETTASVLAADRGMAIADLYPSPAASTLSMNLWITHPGTYEVGVSDLTGRSVASNVVPVSETGDTHLEIETQDLRNGIYLLCIVGGQGIIKRTFVVCR